MTNRFWTNTGNSSTTWSVVGRWGVNPTELTMGCDTIGCTATVSVEFEADLLSVSQAKLRAKAEELGWKTVEGEEGQEDLNYCPEHAEWIET